jgi:hypothetical protein
MRHWPLPDTEAEEGKWEGAGAQRGVCQAEGGGGRSSDTGTNAAEAGTGQATRQCVQGGNRGRGARGPVRGKRKENGPGPME